MIDHLPAIGVTIFSTWIFNCYLIHDGGDGRPFVVDVNTFGGELKDASCVVTDVWVSMHDTDATSRHNLLKPYQVNARLMRLATPQAVFMHCLPAHRGEEVTAEVIDGPQSVVFDEAENRLHVQKGILLWCLGNNQAPS